MPVTHFIWDRVSDNVLYGVDDAGVENVRYMNELGKFGSLILVFLPNQVGENLFPAIA